MAEGPKTCRLWALAARRALTANARRRRHPTWSDLITRVYSGFARIFLDTMRAGSRPTPRTQVQCAEENALSQKPQTKALGKSQASSGGGFSSFQQSFDISALILPSLQNQAASAATVAAPPNCLQARSTAEIDSESKGRVLTSRSSLAEL